MFAFQWARSIGTRNLYSPVGLELSSKYLANRKLFGCSFRDGYPDYRNSKYVLLVGTNPLISWSLHGRHLAEAAKDPERTVVVVDPDNPTSKGYTCLKGRAEVERIYHPERLLSFKKLTNGRRVHIPTEQALDEIAGKLRAIIAQPGTETGSWWTVALGPWRQSKKDRET